MRYELSISVGNEHIKAFLQKGFFEHDNQLTTFFHKHNYSEIHVIKKGCALLITDEHEVKITSGDAFLIPSGVMHRFAGISSSVISVSFLIDETNCRFQKQPYPVELIGAFMHEIDSAEESGNYITVESYLSLFCSHLLPEKKLSVSEINDYAFLIGEFFTENYNRDIRVSDLARQLHLSEKQSERLVIRYTGHTFRDELVSRRIKAAKMLAADETMSLKDIAEYVGYQSYSGFWKAYRKSHTIS